MDETNMTIHLVLFAFQCFMLFAILIMLIVHMRTAKSYMKFQAGMLQELLERGVSEDLNNKKIRSN